MIFEWDDMGADHIISDQCQSHDCRDQLLRLKEVNSLFKATLFAIPGEMTQELLNWSYQNAEWVELAVHGFYHDSNYECEKMSHDEFGANIEALLPVLKDNFEMIFRAPGWQISTEAMQWLADNDWVIADQGYNDERRPKMNAYVNYDGRFEANGKEIEAYHGHTWNVGWNGIYEDYDKVEKLVREAKEFKFVSELF